ncbi:MAG TPA: NADH-quinone oxidoreductase subunit C [Solirubrobacterales bacterium]|nr:NADH-quinone oxidoreductase subunit C [Solirubrobacterales bacterium]
MPDAPGLELIRGEIEQYHPGAVLDTSFDRGQAALIVDPAQIVAVLSWLRDAPGQEYGFLSSLHGVDYLPATPRFGVHYELLNRDRVERLRVKAMLADPAAGPAGPVAAGDPPPPAVAEASSGEVPPATPPAGDVESLPEIDSCVELFPTAEFQEREVFDFFGIRFRGHPDLRRILMPDDYVGWPQRRDFPVGGEPVRFTYNERNYG